MKAITMHFYSFFSCEVRKKLVNLHPFFAFLATYGRGEGAKL